MDERSHAPGRPDEKKPLRLVVLAGRRRSGADRLADRFGTSHKCLIPLAGRPLIAHVLQTGASHPRVGSLAVCIERDGFEPIYDVLTRLPGRGTVELVEARDNLVDSIRAAAEGWDGPLIITTADHPLLRASSITVMAEALEGADVAVALARREAVEAAHASGWRRYLSLRDGDFAVCDLYGMTGPDALRAVEVFRGRDGFGGGRRRIVRAMGFLGLFLLAFGFATLPRAVDRASRRLGLKVSAVILGDGSQAIDVDDDHSYAVVRDLLERRPQDEEPPVQHAAVA
jgi:GTP:adenosylcobinamide-phosphate guanylyltransferase